MADLLMTVLVSFLVGWAIADIVGIAVGGIDRANMWVVLAIAIPLALLITLNMDVVVG